MSKGDPEHARRVEGLSPQQKALLLHRLKRAGTEAPGGQGLRRRGHDGPVPLSVDQERMWLIEQMAPGTPAFNLNWACFLRGPLDVPTLARGVELIARRHESLRTTFTDAGGRLCQLVHAEMAIPLSVEDLTHVPPVERRAALERRLEEAAWRPFDLRRGPLLRMTLVKTDARQHALLLTIHHIVADHASFAVFGRELGEAYRALSAGQRPQLPELPAQFGDFAIWQRAHLEGPAFERLAGYWRRQLRDAPAATALPTDHMRPAVQSFKGAIRPFGLPAHLRQALEAVARQQRASPFMLCLAAFGVLLHRHSGQTDLVVGAPMTNRLVEGTEGMIGYLLNLLPIRIAVGGNPTFEELLGKVRTASLEAYSHQGLPFGTLVQLAGTERHLSHSPLFQTCLVYLDAEDPFVSLPGVSTAPLTLGKQGSRLDLTLAVWESGEGLGGFFEYNTGLWEPDTIDWMIEHFRQLLDGIASDPGQRIGSVPLPCDRRQTELRGPRRASASPAPGIALPSPHSTLAGLFEAQVRALPDQVAVEMADLRWTYARLNDEADRVRRVLARNGQPERVALLFEPCASMLAAILGVLKTGSAYVPLDAHDPERRLQSLLENSGAKLILTDEGNAPLARRLAGPGGAVIDLDRPDDDASAFGTLDSSGPSPDSFAYLLYTSGSTAHPKAVVQTHRNVIQHILTYSDALRISPRDRLSLLPSYAFDAAVMDIFAALLTGATLCLFDVRRDGVAGLPGALADRGVTVYHSTPTLFRLLLESLGPEVRVPGVRVVVLGGEAAHRGDVEGFRRQFSRDCLLVNGFGPSECTVALQCFVDADTSLARDAVPIGFPVQGTQVLLLDGSGEPTSPFGEIAIRSSSVATGYWGRPDLTAAAFVPDPAGHGRRLYRTGDLGRLLPDGSLEFVGRRDLQAKVRGFRVDPGEIESVLVTHPGVAQSAVVVRGESFGETRLLACIVPRGEPAPRPGELRRFLAERIPDYLIPTDWISLDALPLTPNGKVDRRRLPEVDTARPAAGPGGTAPRTVVERELVSIWSEVLGVSAIGVEDEFLALGGHSISAMQILSRIRDAFGVELGFRTFFERPTIADQAVEVTGLLLDDGIPRR